MIDHTKFTRKGEKTAAKDGPQFENMRWWDLTGYEQAQSISASLEVMDRAQLNRISQLVTNSRLYGGSPQASAAGFAYSRYFAAQSVNRDILTYNLTQSCIDTAVAKLSKNKPKPYFLTSGGDFKIQRKAKKLNQFVEGIFYEQKAYEKRALALRDSGVTGDGLIYVHERHGRVVFDRTPSSEWWVDEMEAFYGNPRQIHHVHDVDRYKLAAEFPDFKDMILKAAGAPQVDARTPNIADVVRARESWHLPSGPDSDDGKHVISIDEGTILCEAWEHEFFPVARWSWSPRMFGFWSQGAAEQLSPIHLELNELLRSMQRAHRLACIQMILIENGSKVSKAHLNNEIAHMVSYTGTPPQIITPPICPPETYNQVANLKRSGYEQVGISELNAQGKKPDGLNSGKALREMDDIGSDRFTTISNNDERAVLELGRLAICIARDLAKRDKGYSVKVPGSRFLREIDWKEIDLDDDQFVMQCFPISSLPSDPAGRLQTVQEYIQAGAIPLDVGMKLLEFPDLQQYESLQNAMEDRLQQIFDGIVDDGEMSTPEPYYNLQRAKELCLQYIVRGESQNLEPERLEMLHAFNDQLDQMAQAAQDASNQQMAIQALAQKTAGSAAPAAPLPPPTSDLLPNGVQAAA